MKKLILPIMVVASLAFSSTASANAMTNTAETTAVESLVLSAIMTPIQAALMIINGNYDQIVANGWRFKYINGGTTIIVWNIVSGAYGIFAVSSFK